MFLVSVIYIPLITKLKARLFVGSLMLVVKTLCIHVVFLRRIFMCASWLDLKNDASKPTAIDLPLFGGIHDEY